MIYVQAILVLSLTGGIIAILLAVAQRFLANYGPCKITVNDKEPLVVEGGCSLLSALYDNRIFIPSACGGQGTCGFCKVRVLDGGGPLLPTETPYLSKSEVANQTRLACQVKVKKDIVIRVREDFLNVQEFKATVAGARLMTKDTREVTLKLVAPAQISFRPGQYVQIKVPVKKGEPVFRAYSICSTPAMKDVVELLVRLIPGGVGSGYMHSLEVGQEVTFTGPYGEFELDAAHDTQLVCVGGGCGMAPMRSLIRHIRDIDPTRKCVLFFGARTALDTMYIEDFKALQKDMPNFEVHYALSEPQASPEWKGETGFIHESVVKNLAAQGPRQAFLCGPPPMIAATMKALQDKNMPKDRIFYDEF